ncbi:MAG: hypothetical protein CMF38_00125 [Legionellaceae bacterium]|nr:hypothetical protein [Legionellaceae bacterium]HCA88931.1 hypothetical protein [Legionellales bacterium]|tara:strand:- start:1616 stop:4327 length:2712 start_codon:yes stop_codon:yes gene_type:complete
MKIENISMFNFPPSAFEIAIENIELNQSLTERELQAFIEQKLSEWMEDKAINAIKEHLAGNYTAMPHLIELLSYVAECWPTLNDSQKQAIASKIAERVAHCTPGFHNGMFEVVKLLSRAESLPFYIQRIREDLVEKTVLALWFDDTHQRERFFCTARLQGYGVRANTHDAYVGNVNDLRIIQQLEQTFRQYFTPAYLLTVLLDEIEATLRERYDYQGRLVTGYNDYHLYEPWRDFLHCFFAVPEASHFSYDEFLIMNEDVVEDLNWSFVAQKLAETIVTHYSNWPAATKAQCRAFITLEDSEERLKNLTDYLPGDAHVLSFYLLFVNEHRHNPKLQNALGAWVLGQNNASLSEIFLISKPILEWVASLSNLSNELAQKLIAVFNYSDQSNNTILFHALEHYRAAIPALLQILIKFNLATQADILMNIDNDGYSIFMRSIYQNSSTLPLFLEILNKLTPEEQMVLLAQINGEGYSALMIAVLEGVETLKLFVEIINNLIPEQRIELLTDKSGDGESALMSAMLESPAMVQPFVEIINNLTPEEQVKVLNDKNNEELSVLMFAMSLNCEVLQLFKPILIKLKPAQQIALLTQKCKSGYSALFLLLMNKDNNAELLPLFLSMLNELNSEVQLAVLADSGKSNYSPLMIASCFNHEALPILQPIFMQLTPEARLNILTKQNDNGYSTLMLTMMHSPSNFALIFELLDVNMLKPIEQFELLLEKNSHGDSILSLAQHQKMVEFSQLETLLLNIDYQLLSENVITDHNNNKFNVNMLINHHPCIFFKIIEKLIHSKQHVEHFREDLITAANLLKNPAHELSAKSQLILYILNIKSEKRRIGLFGYSKELKYEAANCLLRVLNEPKLVSELKCEAFREPLSQGRLGVLYEKLRSDIAEKEMSDDKKMSIT